jgi:hypothetical protein
VKAIVIFLVIVCEKVAQVHVPAHATGCRAARAAAAGSLQPSSLNSPGDPSPVHVPRGSDRGHRAGIGAAWYRDSLPRYRATLVSRFAVFGSRTAGRGPGYFVGGSRPADPPQVSLVNRQTKKSPDRSGLFLVSRLSCHVTTGSGADIRQDPIAPLSSHSRTHSTMEAGTISGSVRSRGRIVTIGPGRLF